MKPIDPTVLFSEVVKRNNHSYVFDPFLSILDGRERDKLIGIIAGIAGSSGAYANKREFLESLDDLGGKAKVIGDFFGTELGGAQPLDERYLSLELKRIRKIFAPKFENPQTCARLLSYRQLFDVEVRAISESVLALEATKPSVSVTEMWVATRVLVDYYQPAVHNLLRLTGAETRWPLVPSQYRLYIPPWQGKLIVSDPIEAAIHESARNPAAIFRLSPRDFERFLSRIFEAYGYDVQLTSATRDGGADLICIFRMVGEIPVKIAVEAKRYASDRPIGISLVRQFVGANEQIKANKLVYVTTSKFTRDARNYANLPELAGVLVLKELPDIMRWAADFREQQYTVGV